MVSYLSTNMMFTTMHGALVALTLLWCCLLILGVRVQAEASDVTVIKLQSPDDCAARPKAAREKWLLVHFSAVVDESSKGGKPGQKLQSSKEIGVPIAVRLADDEVIPGWIQGLDGVCEGSTVTMVIPPELGYGEDMTVVFEIEILQVSDSQIDEPSLFDVIDTDKDGQISIKEFEEHFEKRPDELDENGKAPMGLFMQEDINQNEFLNWEEFGGPKGAAPPTSAELIIQKEKADPELSKKKKGDPLEIKIDGDKLLNRAGLSGQDENDDLDEL